MLSNSPAEMQADLRRRSAAVKRDIQCACDAAFLRLRDKERQLLRVVDAVGSRQQGDLWAATLLRQQQQQQTNSSAPPPAVQTMTLSLDSHLLERAIEQFAAVRLDGLMTSSSGVAPSSLPDGLEEYGAEEHLVSHKPLPGDPSSVRVTRPPSLAGYSQYYPSRNLSCASSVTSSDEDDKFELIEGPIAELVSSPISKERCACQPRPPLDIESLYLMDCVATPEKADSLSEEKIDRASEEKMDAASEKCGWDMSHPLAGSLQAWLLPLTATDNTTAPSPAAQWCAAMESEPGCAAADDSHRWLLRRFCRANEPCRTAADCVSDCTERVGRLGLTDWRSGWLLPAPAALEPPAAAELTPAVLAPFRQMEKNTTWVATRG